MICSSRTDRLDLEALPGTVGCIIEIDIQRHMASLMEPLLTRVILEIPQSGLAGRNSDRALDFSLLLSQMGRDHGIYR